MNILQEAAAVRLTTSFSRKRKLPMIYISPDPAEHAVLQGSFYIPVLLTREAGRRGCSYSFSSSCSLQRHNPQFNAYRTSPSSPAQSQHLHFGLVLLAASHASCPLCLRSTVISTKPPKRSLSGGYFSSPRCEQEEQNIIALPGH